MKTILTTLLIAVLLAACAPATPPPPTVDAVATAQSMSGTMAAGTLTAQPTNTAIPSATETAIPPTVTRTPKPTATPKPTKAPKPQVFIGCFAPNGIAGKTSPFKIEVYGNRKATVYINGMSRNGDHPIYCTEVVKQGLPVELDLMWGDYTYMIQMGTTTRKGSFFINNYDKATMRIYDDKIQLGPFP